MIDRQRLRRHRLIARTEVRRGYRKIRQRRTQLLVTALGGLMLLIPVLVFAGVLYGLGVGLRTGKEVTALLGPENVRSAVAAVWIGTAGFVSVRTISYRGDPDEPEGLLTTVPVRDVVTGLVLAEATVLAAWVALPLFALGVAFAAGARALAPLLALPVVVVLVLATAIPLGFLVGISLRHALLTLEPIARNKTAVVLVSMVAYLGLLFTDTLGVVAAAAYPFLSAVPPGWFGDLLVTDVPRLAASPLRIVAATALTVVAAPLLVVAGARVAEMHWLSDETTASQPRPDDATGATTSERVAAVLPDGVGRPTRSVVRTVVLRARRAPIKLLYVIYPLFAAVPLLQDVYRLGAVPGYAPWLTAGFVVWAAGAAFTLNVLGDQGATLPVVLSAPDAGRHVVVGHALAGLLVAVVPAVVLTALVGLLAPLAVVETLALAAVTAVGVVGATLLATGVGVTFPRFGTVKVASDREATAPSKSAFAVYSVLVTTFLPICWLAASASAPGWIARLLAEVAGVATSSGVVRALAALALVAWLALSAVSALLALRRVESYAL
jgi:hypothetical protein